MKAEVTQIHADGVCGVRTANKILLVFGMPPVAPLSLGDVLEIDELVLDKDMPIRNLTRGTQFVVRVPAMDAHDLHLPARHGSSRTPSLARMRDP
jgi:hypothetical protein